MSIYDDARKNAGTISKKTKYCTDSHYTSFTESGKAILQQIDWSIEEETLDFGTGEKTEQEILEKINKAEQYNEIYKEENKHS